METSINQFFGKIKDPRIERKKLYPLNEILLVALSSIVCGGDGFEDMRLFGLQKLEILKNIYPFENGIASADTFSRVFQLLDPKMFSQCFADWVKDFYSRTNRGIAIDGKVLRGSFSENQKALNMVSACVHEEGFVLAQTTVNEKSNEITAIPELLEILDIKGSIITIDAMGCQKDIAKKIIDKKGDYILGLKGNQSSLESDVKKVFEGIKKPKFSELNKKEDYNIDKDHGRIEIRICTAISVENIPINILDWSGIKTLVEIKSYREFKDKKSEEIRYYISSLKNDAKQLNDCIRGHWTIENKLHWVLDMTFHEDLSRVRKGHSAKNFGILRHTALNLLKNDQERKISMRQKRKLAGWNNDYLLKIITQDF